MDKKPKPLSMLHPDPSHMQGYTKTQNKGMEEDLPTKWRAKKKKKKAGVSVLVSEKMDIKLTTIKKDKGIT